MLKETADLVRDGVPNIYLFYILSIFSPKIETEHAVLEWAKS